MIILSKASKKLLAYVQKAACDDPNREPLQKVIRFGQNSLAASDGFRLQAAELPDEFTDLPINVPTEIYQANGNQAEVSVNLRNDLTFPDLTWVMPTEKSKYFEATFNVGFLRDALSGMSTGETFTLRLHPSIPMDNSINGAPPENIITNPMEVFGKIEEKNTYALIMPKYIQPLNNPWKPGTWFSKKES
jgi:hypothetical protein